MQSAPRGGIIAVIATLLLLAGCSTKMSEKERQNISVAYAEMLIAKNMHRSDTAAANRAADSVLKHYGFAGEQELMAKIKELANDPESLRLALDSTQHRLERIQQGFNPDAPPQRPMVPAPAQKIGR